jgi:hypothetical protein
MEPTITQNSALYLAHRRLSKRRATFFRRIRAAAGKHGPDAQRQLTPVTYSSHDDFIRTTGAKEISAVI